MSKLPQPNSSTLDTPHHSTRGHVEEAFAYMDLERVPAPASPPQPLQKPQRSLANEQCCPEDPEAA